MKYKIKLKGLDTSVKREVLQICFNHGLTWQRTGAAIFLDVDYIVIYPRKIHAVNHATWSTFPIQNIAAYEFIDLYGAKSAVQPADVVEQYKIDFNHYADPNSIIDAVLKVCFNKGIRWSNGTSQGLRPEYIIISGKHIKSVNRGNFKASTFAQVDAGTYVTMNNGKPFLEGKGIIKQAAPTTKTEHLAFPKSCKSFSQWSRDGLYSSIIEENKNGDKFYHLFCYGKEYDAATSTYEGVVTLEHHNLKMGFDAPRLHPYQKTISDMIRTGSLTPMNEGTVNCRCAATPIPTGKGKTKSMHRVQHVPKLKDDVHVHIGGTKIKGLEYTKGAVWFDDAEPVHPKDLEKKYEEWRDDHPKISDIWGALNTNTHKSLYIQQIGRARRVGKCPELAAPYRVTEYDAVAVNYAASLKATAHVIDAAPINTNPDAPAITFLGDYNFPRKL